MNWIMAQFDPVLKYFVWGSLTGIHFTLWHFLGVMLLSNPTLPMLSIQKLNTYRMIVKTEPCVIVILYNDYSLCCNYVWVSSRKSEYRSTSAGVIKPCTRCQSFQEMLCYNKCYYFIIDMELQHHIALSQLERQLFVKQKQLVFCTRF